MICVGIDPGLAFVGFGFVRLDGREWVRIASGVIVTSGTQSLAARLAEIAGDLAQLVALHKPDLAAYERMTVMPGAGDGTAKALMAAGVIAAVLGGAGLPTVEYPPQSWKAGIVPASGGGGRAEKSDVKAAVRDLLRLDYLPRTDHEADALAIAMHRGNRAGFDE